MKFLLDVNILVALAWPGHVFHQRAHAWFARVGHKGWATCPFTQCGMVRILSNPGMSRKAVGVSEAMSALSAYVGHRNHTFWPADVPLHQAIRALHERVSSYRQITDAYLLGLAILNRGKLATFDEGIRALAPPGSHEEPFVELVG